MILNNEDKGFGIYTAQIVVLFFILVLQIIGFLVFIVFIFLVWVFALAVMIITLVFSALIYIFSCGKLNVFGRILRYLRRRRLNAQNFIMNNMNNGLNFDKLVQKTSKKWIDYKQIIKLSPYNQDNI